jgi:hypothetical protein
MLTVQGIYEKGTIQIKESVPDFERCEVFVTFLPIECKISEINSVKEKNEAIDNLLGICEGNTLTLDDVRRERLSRQ